MDNAYESAELSNYKYYNYIKYIKAYNIIFVYLLILDMVGMIGNEINSRKQNERLQVNLDMNLKERKYLEEGKL